MSLRALSACAIAVTLSACAPKPAIPVRAIEANDMCAQHIKDGDLTRAEVQCDLGLQFYPDLPDLWVNKGIIADLRGQMEVAKKHYVKALRLNQDQAQAYNNLGYIYLREREYGKAHDNFQRALKVNPDYTLARYNLGLALTAMGDRERAKKEFRTIIAIDARLADPPHMLCVIALEEKSYDEAIDNCTAAVTLDPGYASAWQNLGVAQTESGKYCEAKESFTSCLSADENNAGCRNNATLVNRKCALLDPTLNQAKEATAGENTPASLYALGRNYKERGLVNEEERTYRRCVKLDKRYAPCYYGLFEVYESDRRDREAKIACENFLKFAISEEFPKEVENCEKYVSAH